MTTDWKRIRDLMAAVIDTCEDIEPSGYGEGDREHTVALRGQVKGRPDKLIAAVWGCSSHPP
jgi:hypothetical protein